jgi:2-oxoglutarate dehydrogenase E1 component
MRPSFATHLNLDVLEENYRRWQDDPGAVDSGWSAFFEGFELGNLEKRNGAATAELQPRTEPGERSLQTRRRVGLRLSNSGHTIAELNPLADKRPENPLPLLRELPVQREGPRHAGLLGILHG